MTGTLVLLSDYLKGTFYSEKKKILFDCIRIFDSSFSYFSLVFDQPGRSSGEEIRAS